MTAPKAERRPFVTRLHGAERVDDYAWLRDKDDPEVTAYLEAENAYAKQATAPTEALQKRLYEEMLGRIQEDDRSVPHRRGAYWYYSRTEEGRAYRIYCRKKGTLEAPEEIILDVNALAKGKKYLDVGVLEVSPDHVWLAYSTDEEGDERYVLRFLNLETGQHTPESIPDTWGTLAWSTDNRTVFYDVVDEASRPYRLYRHRVGGDPQEDALVYEEADDRFFLSASLTRSERFVMVELESAVTSEVRYLDAARPESELRLLRPRVQGVEYDVEHQGDRFLMRTNEGALNFELREIPLDDPSRERVLIPHRDDVTISGVLAFAKHLVLFERRAGLPRIRVLSEDGGDHQVAFEEPVYDVWAGANETYDTTTFRFGYTSLVTPDSIFDYDLVDRTRELKKREPVIGYDASRYAMERISVAAADGTEIPISLVYAKTTPRDGSAPLFLHGYGSYGISYDPSFDSSWVSLLDRGMIVAIAHVRGGGEMGRAWKEAGKLKRKVNTFTDFIACAEALIARRYTSADRLAITGRSAGGLLVGAVLNMRPDLFRVAIAGVPFVDVVNTMLDETIPLTVIEWEEWGNPKVKDDYETMVAYSPYDNVKAQAYPDLLVLAGLNDPRVGYWEAAKWVAKLRALATGDALILLKTKMEAGHGGWTGRYQRLEARAFEYAFLLDRLGVHE